MCNGVRCWLARSGSPDINGGRVLETRDVSGRMGEEVSVLGLIIDPVNLVKLEGGVLPRGLKVGISPRGGWLDSETGNMLGMLGMLGMVGKVGRSGVSGGLGPAEELRSSRGGFFSGLLSCFSRPSFEGRLSCETDLSLVLYSSVSRDFELSRDPLPEYLLT